MFKKKSTPTTTTANTLADHLTLATTSNDEYRVLQEELVRQAEAARRAQQQQYGPSPSQLGQLAQGLGPSQSPWQSWNQEIAMLAGIRFTKSEIQMLRKLLDVMKRNKQMDTLPDDVEQAVKEAVGMLK